MRVTWSACTFFCQSLYIVCVCMYIYIYIYIQSASKESGCGLFVHRMYEEFHINLWECSMYGCCYIFFSIQVYLTKLAYRAATIQLEGNTNLVCHYKFILAENIIIPSVSSVDYTFKLMLKKSKYELQYVCLEKKERKTYINFKFSGENKRGQNNKVLEKLRNQKKGVPVN